MTPSISSAITNLSNISLNLKSTILDSIAATTPSPPHPLDPLTAAELKLAVSAIRNHALAEYPSGRLWFKFCTLLEPPKVDLKPWLESYHCTGSSQTDIPRWAQSLLAVKTDVDGKTHVQYYEYKIQLVGDGTATVVGCEKIRSTAHTALDMDEMNEGEKALLSNEEFRATVKSLNLPEGSEIVADPWCYGCDSYDPTPRYIQFMMYFRPPQSTHPDTNHYAFPLPLIPSLYTSDFSLAKIEWTPIYGGESTKTVHDLPGGPGSFPWEKLMRNEYNHSLQVDSGGVIREGLKPFEVVQNLGSSFEVNGHEVEWQKWKFRVGFNFREGLTIHDVRYDNRNIVHRLSISDMTVPYGDPRAPLHRKQAFDLGDFGAGVCANQLDLGCDCLGRIHYFSADIINSSGEVLPMKNVICLHELDEGLGWKHTNFRTGVASVTRSRVLEYIFAYKFDQAAAIHLETRATGILSTNSILPGETSPYGNVVNPGVLANNHQHLFSYRIDPAIDGHENSVVQEDSVAMAYDPKNPPKNNPYGVGYTVEKTLIEKAGWADAAPEKNRVFKIINPNKINPISGKPIGYKLVPQPSQLILAHPESIAAKRAEFANHHIWVTTHRDEELFAAGHYTQQSSGNAKGIRSWVAREDKVDNADIVIWHTFGLTHNPRVEDFPVMPCETHTISLKPADFFSKSPSIDVPASRQKENKSVLFTDGPGVCGDCCKV